MSETNLEIKIANLESRLGSVENKVEDLLTEIKHDMAEIKASTNLISTILIKQDYQKEALDRAFSRIEKLEVGQKEVEAYHNKIDGARQFAWGLWALLSSGVIVSLFKLFGG